MRVKPEAIQLHTPSQVDLPYAFQRESLDVFVERLATVQRVREDVVQIQEQPAVRAFTDSLDEFSVRDLVLSGAQVVHAGFHRDGYRKRSLQITN